MGIRVPPEPDPSGDDLLVCFPAGQTPFYIYVSLSGITKGAIWAAWMPEPPNRTFRLEQNDVDETYWEYWGDSIDLRYYAENGPTGGNEAELEVFFGGIPLFSIFFKSKNEKCIFSFENQFQAAGGRRFYGGYAFITWLI